MDDKIAIIFPGGGTSGAFQMGVLKVLSKKIEPDFFMGTSTGAINACGLARGKNLRNEIKKAIDGWISLSNKRNNFFGIKKIPFPPFSLYKNDNLKKLIIEVFGEKIGERKLEDLDRKVYVGAINLSLRKVEFFEKGNLFDILMASCAIPPFLPYYKFNNSLYLDCGPDVYSSIREADKLGANKIIVIKTPKSNNNSVKNPLFALKKMFDVILDQHFDSICNGKLKDNIHTILPKDGTPNPINSLKYTKELIEAGEGSGEKFLREHKKDF